MQGNLFNSTSELKVSISMGNKYFALQVKNPINIICMKHKGFYYILGVEALNVAKMAKLEVLDSLETGYKYTTRFKEEIFNQIVDLVHLQKKSITTINY